MQLGQAHKSRIPGLASTHLGRWAPWLLSALPLAYLVFVVARYSVDVPYWDQWELVPVLEGARAGV